MSEALSLKDPGMIELGAVLSELVGELHTSIHNRLYAEFLRLQNEGLDAANIAEGLLLFIQYDEQHPAYPKLKKALKLMEGFDAEPATDIRTRQTQPVDDEIRRLREQHAVDELLESFVKDEDRETVPDVGEARHTAQTLTNEGGVEVTDDDPFERDTLLPEDFPPKK